MVDEDFAMPPPTTFDEVLDAIEHLPPEQQADLIRVIQRRLAEQGRQRIVEDVRDARAEFEKGGASPANVDELIREIKS
jgi:transcriptional regulator with AAA-type ATPase domain